MRQNSLTVSSVLLTICLLSLVPLNMRLASTWQDRFPKITNRLAIYNYEASLAFASLALIIIGITVIWTGYRQGLRWAWIVMAVIVGVYYIPVYLLDFFLELSRVGGLYLPALFREALEGRPFAFAVVKSLVTLSLMLIALFLPMSVFFGKNSFLSTGNQLAETELGGKINAAKSERSTLG